ncbi:hypothetical protein [Ruegeria sp.]|uniref:hypothetical protein n=1 Tax=Ruegeria sp. TaxID=1879320 RepID=UPI002315E9EE|nr:hypothetical protein [Ruegeria sp.]MDA7963382.1 hypothetical protein [Ruegeria sp.]
MTAKHRYHGGLQFSGSADHALERFSDIVAATLEDYGHLVERKSLLNPSEASIVTSQYLVRLQLEVQEVENTDRYERMDRAAGLKTLTRPAPTRPRNRLAMTISPVSELLDDSEISEMMLVVALYRMVDICSTQRIEWLSPKTVLTLEQFLGAFDTLAPRKPRDRKQIFNAISGPFAGLDLPDPLADMVEPAKAKPRPIQLTDDQLLSIAFRTEPEAPISSTPAPDVEDERPSDILRLTTWGMTGAVASISAPIAMSMAAVNLIRGEDFRLNTQVLALTTAIFGLNTSGAIAGVVNVLGM